MRQSMTKFKMHRYRLQPGDGTAYEFFLAPICRPAPHDVRCVEAETGEEIVPVFLHEIVTGVGTWIEAAEDFITLGICMPGHQGTYEVRKSSLRDPRSHFVGYLSGKMGGLYPYTVAAVVLAASVLVDEPMALEKAAEAMLRAPELLRH